MEDAAHLMQHFGTNVLMAKIEGVKEAYRIIPFHPDDCPFLGLHWKGQVHINYLLPFGLASAPAIFSAVGEVLKWALQQRGVRATVHYLDEFLFVGSPARMSVSEHYPLHWPHVRS